ncbi:MAG: hypothetical protein JWO25_3793, partial [Alphaproteobacteria bacterium]|nr:hypothetical protein [Alphaproteobacteria bacterium]
MAIPYLAQFRPYQTKQHNRLQQGRPTGFNPVQLVYRKLGSSVIWYYTDARPDYPVLSNFDIKTFASRVATGGITIPNGTTVQVNSPLAIPIMADSYIMIELEVDSRLPYSFSAIYDGIDLDSYTLDHPNPKSLYGDLHHVDTAGNVSKAATANC